MIIQLIPNLKIVILESPYDTIQDPLVRELFSKIVQLKIEGYRMVYPYGVLPVDAYDFIATHQLICRETASGLQVLMGAKYVTLKKCQIHNLPFPGISLLRAASAHEHEKALSEHLAHYAQNPEKVSYGSSWAIGSEARANPVLKKTLRDLLTVTLIHHEEELETTERFCCGAGKVKTDEYFMNVGYQKLQSRGQDLPTFKQASLCGEPAIMLRCLEFSESAKELAKAYQAMWDARLVIKNQDAKASRNQEVA